jgi:hypothetical protein
MRKMSPSSPKSQREVKGDLLFYFQLLQRRTLASLCYFWEHEISLRQEPMQLIVFSERCELDPGFARMPNSEYDESIAEVRVLV